MVIVIGHRGAAGLEPENTLRSIKAAIEIGVDEVEIDVRVSKDGYLVVIHDETVDRTTNGHGFVRDLTLKEIKNLDAGQGEQVPTLKEVLDLTRNKVVLDIELKVSEALNKTLCLIEEMKIQDHVVLISFKHDLLLKARSSNPNIRTGAIFFESPKLSSLDVIKKYADGIYVHYRNINKDLIDEAHSKNLRIGVWTVNSISDMKRMIRLGVDAVTTDRPDLLIRLLNSLFKGVNHKSKL